MTRRKIDQSNCTECQYLAYGTKLTLKSQTAAEMITSKSWVLSTKQGYKKVYIRKNMNEEERKNFKEMIVDVKKKNEERTEEEKEQFFWRIRNDKVMKWWRKKE